MGRALAGLIRDGARPGALRTAALHILSPLRSFQKAIVKGVLMRFRNTTKQKLKTNVLVLGKS